MADERRTKAILEYEARTDQAIRGIERVIDRVADQRKGLADVAAAAKRAGDAQVEAANQALSPLKKYRDALEAIRKEEERAAEAAKARKREESRGTAKSAGGSVIDIVGQGSTVGGALASVAGGNTGVGQAAGLAGDILGAVESLGKFKQELGGLSGNLGSALAVAGPLAVGIAAVTAAGAIYLDNVKQQSAALASLARVQKDYFDTLNQGTTEDAQAQLKTAQEDLKSLEQQRANLKKEIDDTFVNETKQGFNDLGARIRTGFKGIFDEGFKEAQSSLANLDKQILDARTKIDLYSKGIEQNAFVAGDAAEAERKLAEARAARIDQEVQASVKQVEILRSGTTEQIELRLAAAKREQEIYKNAITRLESIGDQASLDKANVLRERLQALDIEIGNLGAALPVVTAREEDLSRSEMERAEETRTLIAEEDKLSDSRQKEIDFIEKAAEAMNSFAEETERIDDDRLIRDRRERQDFGAKRLQDQLAFARRQAETDAAHYKDRAKKIADFNASLGQEEQTALKERAKEVAALNLEQIRAAEDFAQTIRGIQNSIGDAAANLDAVGVRAAKRQLRDATDQYEKERRRRDEVAQSRLDEITANAEAEKAQRAEAFQAQLADEDAQYEEERRRDQDAFRIQQQQEDDARRVRLERQREDDARQDERRRQSFEKQIASLQSQLLQPEEKAKVDSYARQRKALGDMLRGAESDIEATKARVANSAAASAASRSSAMTSASVYNSSLSSSASSRTSADSFARRFANGGTFGAGDFGVLGDVRGPELIQFGAAGRVYSPDQTRGMLGGRTFQHNGDVYLGRDLAPAEMREQVRQYMADEFDLLAAGGQ